MKIQKVIALELIGQHLAAVFLPFERGGTLVAKRGLVGGSGKRWDKVSRDMFNPLTVVPSILLLLDAAKLALNKPIAPSLFEVKRCRGP